MNLGLIGQQAPPQGINYQATLYVPSTKPLPGTNGLTQVPANKSSVEVVFTIEEGMNGPVVFQENHQDTTDELGLLELIIGQGSPTISSFNQVDWSLGDLYLRVSITILTTNTTINSYQKLWSVPYSLYSGRSNTTGYSDSSGHSNTSDTSLYSHNSGHSNTSDTSLYSHNSGHSNTSDTSLYSHNSGHSNTSDTSLYSHNSGHSNTSDTSLYSHNSGHSNTSDTSLYSHNSGHSNTSDTSLYSHNSGHSNTSDTSLYSHNSGHAQVADTALNAWRLTGNSGTTPNTNFIGTTDTQDWVIKTDNIERMRVMANGNVGVGTSSPNSKLDLQGHLTLSDNSDFRRFKIEMEGLVDSTIPFTNIRFDAYNRIPNSGVQFRFFRETNTTAEKMVTFYQGNGLNVPSARIRVGNTGDSFFQLDGGNFGIGTATPDQRFSVNGNASKAGGGSWATFSDKRVKQDINPFNDGLNILMGLNPVTYRYNEKSGYTDLSKTFVGFIAQDVKKIAPYMVTTYDDSHGPSGLNDKLQFDESALTKILVNSIQEQQLQIDDLKKQINDLKLLIKK